MPSPIHDYWIKISNAAGDEVYGNNYASSAIFWDDGESEIQVQIPGCVQPGPGNPMPGTLVATITGQEALDLRERLDQIKAFAVSGEWSIHNGP